MSARVLASTLFGVAGVWMLAQLLAGVGMVVDFLPGAFEAPWLGTPGFVLMLSGHLLAGLGLLLGRDRLAARLFPDAAMDVPSAAVLLDVGFRLAGVMVLARGVERLGWGLPMLLSKELAGASRGPLLQAGLLLAFGLGLLLGARPLVALLHRLRTAGLATDSKD